MLEEARLQKRIKLGQDIGILLTRCIIKIEEKYYLLYAYRKEPGLITFRAINYLKRKSNWMQCFIDCAAEEQRLRLKGEHEPILSFLLPRLKVSKNTNQLTIETQKTNEDLIQEKQESKKLADT